MRNAGMVNVVRSAAAAPAASRGSRPWNFWWKSDTIWLLAATVELVPGAPSEALHWAYTTWSFTTVPTGALSSAAPVAFATSADPVAAAKVAVEFAKTNDKFEIVGGAMGATVLSIDGVKALATLPSLDELRARIVGLVQAPATKLAQLVNAPAGKLARVFGAYALKEAA